MFEGIAEILLGDMLCRVFYFITLMETPMYKRNVYLVWIFGLIAMLALGACSGAGASATPRPTNPVTETPIPAEGTAEATGEATSEATEAATSEATTEATEVATEEATEAATEEATAEETVAAAAEITEVATEVVALASTDVPTEEFTEVATEVVTEEATEASTEEVVEATEAATEEVVEATEVATEEATEEATEVVVETTPTPTEPTEEATVVGGEFTLSPITSVCLITDVGKVNDGTFNQFAYDGMVRAVEEFGLESTFIETQAQTDYENNINTCLGEGYQAIVTVGFAFADTVLVIAPEHPDVLFIGVDQTIENAPPNVVGIQFREDQAGFLVGAMAALVTQSGTVAGVYGLDIPPVIKFRNGYEQGARYINPDINVLGVYIDDFQAPDRGAAAAEQFLGAGADVIFGAGGPTGSGAIAYAATAGAWVIGVDQDEYATTFGNGETPGADRLISSAVKRVDNGVYHLLSVAAAGDTANWPGGSSYVLEVANDGITFAPPHDSDLSQEVTDQVTAILEGLRDGSIETGVDPVSGELLEPLAEGTVEATIEATEAATTEATAEATP
jgi:basic membrane protein A and related proteins